MAKKLHNKVGPPVEGDDFFGRETEIAENWTDIQDGHHVLITAPRRIGKSSLVKRIIKEARDAGWKAAYVDVQGVTDEIGFYKTFVDTLNVENETWFTKGKKAALDAFNAALGMLEAEWNTDAGTVKLKLAGIKAREKEIKDQISNLLGDKDDLLIAIDELPIFLARLEKEEEGKNRISDLLHWLRSYRQQGSRTRWIFCGSIGMDTFTEKLNLSESLNDVPKYNLGAFTPSTAVDFLTKLGNDNGLPLTPANISAILEIIGWPLPFFLQAHFKELNRIKSRQQNNAVTEDDIKQAYQNILKNTTALKTWEERLNEQLTDDDATYCKVILTNICKSKKGLSRKKLFDQLYTRINNTDKCNDKLGFCLKLLERDGYIIYETDKNYVFRSPLLRDFWHDLKVK